ncbi:unnamed protein product [Dicrocoelium dendriticum]|nr:unnamed protein product [Dicrocoelium dendriticum]
MDQLPQRDIGDRTSVDSPTRSSHKTSSCSSLCSTTVLPLVPSPNPVSEWKPFLVFINPQSGGNQGYSLLHKFRCALNQRQVFDLSQNGPKTGLQLYNGVPNLRILACGGDGTVSWVLSTIEELNMAPAPPVAVLPLGTGNDLSRTLGWGSRYTGEPISKVLRNIEFGEVVQLDRWKVEFESQAGITTTFHEADDMSVQMPVISALPVKVFNNYFSLGADAAATLGFHESREKNPERFNSRLQNKMAYARYGGKDILLRSWKNLSEYITLHCDGNDFTPLIRSLKPHVLLFLNIPKYSSGTLPWGTAPPDPGFEPARIDDGLLEVIGLSSAALALIQVGGHGDRICQCRTATLTTSKNVPVQLDGEPYRLLPSRIEIRHSHRASVVRKCGGQIISFPNTRVNLVLKNNKSQSVLICDRSQGKYASAVGKPVTFRQAG